VVPYIIKKALLKNYILNFENILKTVVFNRLISEFISIIFLLLYFFEDFKPYFFIFLFYFIVLPVFAERN